MTTMTIAMTAMLLNIQEFTYTLGKEKYLKSGEIWCCETTNEKKYIKRFTVKVAACTAADTRLTVGYRIAA